MTGPSFDAAIARQCRVSSALKRALNGLGAHAGQLLVHEQRAWRSITFQGTRHRLTYAFDGTDAVEKGEQLIALLPDHEFAIPGQLIADASVPSVEHRTDPPRLVADLELLLLEED